MNERECHQNGIIHKLKRVFEFITLLNVEVFIFFVMMTYQMKKIPTDQLIQDKICIQKYKLSSNYCTALPTMKKEEDYLHMKTDILEDVTHFSLYSTLTFTVPAVLASVLVGSWTDKYQGAKKSLMIAGAVAGVLENCLMIVNVYFFDKSENYTLFALLPSCCMGGLLAIFTALWSYIASTTPPKLRSLRMLIAEVVIFSAIPIGTIVGGKVLNTRPTFKDGQLHNYTMVFIIAGIANFMALIWVLLRVNEKRDIKLFRDRFHMTECIEMERKGQVVCDKQQQFNDNKHIHPLKLLFNLQNIKDIIVTCCKPRTNHVRLQIWLLFLSMLCYLMSHMGTTVFLFPFVQKVYQWNSDIYSVATAIGNVINALSTLLIAPILIKIVKVKDTTLTILGLCGYFSQNMIRGLVLNPTGFYISLITGAMGSITSVGIRSHMSKIVEPKELGKVFCLMSAIDSVAPLMSSLIFSNVFNATMDTMPGISFLILAGMLILPLLIAFWTDIYTVLPDFKKSNENNFNNECNTDSTKM